MHIFSIFLLGVWKSRYLQMNNCDLLCYSVLWENAPLKALSMTGLNGIILHHTRLNKLEKWNQYYINLSGDSLPISPLPSPSVLLKYKWIYSVSCRWTQKIFIEMWPRRSEHKKTAVSRHWFSFFRMDFTHLSNLFSRPVISGLRRRKWQFIYKKAIKWFSAFVSMLNVKHDISFRLENEKPFGVITVAFVWGSAFIVSVGIYRGFAVPSCNKLRGLCVSADGGIYFRRNEAQAVEHWFLMEAQMVQAVYMLRSNGMESRLQLTGKKF